MFVPSRCSVIPESEMISFYATALVFCVSCIADHIFCILLVSFSILPFRCKEKRWSCSLKKITTKSNVWQRSKYVFLVNKVMIVSVRFHCDNAV